MIKGIILAITGFLLIFSLGWTGHGAYEAIKNERTLNGLHISGTGDWDSTKEVAYELDGKGDWVCINVAYEMSPALAYETCIHECSHNAFSEIYAEECEADPVKCLEVLNE